MDDELDDAWDCGYEDALGGLEAAFYWNGGEYRARCSRRRAVDQVWAEAYILGYEEGYDGWGDSCDW